MTMSLSSMIEGNSVDIHTDTVTETVVEVLSVTSFSTLLSSAINHVQSHLA